jgi:hypothetical protein
MSFQRVLFAAMGVVLSTLLVLAVGEIGLRVLYPNRAPRTPDAEELAFEFNESYLVALKKSINKEFPGQQSVSWRTNEDGFRGEPLRHADKRVMVYGDSNVLARFSALVDSYPAQLAMELSRGLALDVEVVNAGVVGFGPDQSLLKMEDELDRFRPDLVVFHIFADNDFGDLIRNRLFDVDDQGGLVATSHPREPDVRFTGESPFWSSLLLVRAVRKVLDSYWNESNLQSHFEVYQRGEPQVASHFTDMYDTDLALYPELPSSIAKRALMDAVLQRARDVTASRSLELLVVVQPATFDLTTNMTPNYEDFSAVESYSPSNLTRFATESAERANLSVLNLFDSFRDNDPAQLFFTHGDNHWNERGQALAAREVARFIIERNLL